MENFLFNIPKRVGKYTKERSTRETNIQLHFRSIGVNVLALRAEGRVVRAYLNFNVYNEQLENILVQLKELGLIVTKTDVLGEYGRVIEITIKG